MMANTWRHMRARSQDLCQIMRDINALQAAVSGWRVVGYIGSPWGIYDVQHNGYASGDYMAATATDAVYVSSSDDDWLKRFNADGSFAWKVAVGDPRGVCCDSTENVFVASETDGKIYKYDSSGAALTSWNIGWTGAGAMACDSSGNVFLRASSHRILKWSNTGTLAWDNNFSGTGLASALTVDEDGILHAAIAGGGIARIDSSGTVLGSYGSVNVTGLACDGDRVFAGGGGTVGNRGLLYTYTKAGVLSDTLYLPNFQSTGFAPTANSNLYAHTFQGPSSSSLDIAASTAGSIFCSTQNFLVQKWTEGQTEWRAYTTDAKVSLGTPDGGTAAPNLNAMYSNAACFDYRQIVDCQIAIQGLTRLYDFGDGYAFTFIPRPVSATILSMGNLFPGIGFTCDQVLPLNHYLTISGVTGTTNANGTWMVVAAGSGYDYQLVGRTHNSAWTGGGSVVDSRNLYANAMGDRTAYGATGGTAYGWTRSGLRPVLPGGTFNPCQGPSAVLGTDGYPYFCTVRHAASSSTRPITGGSYVSYWAPMWHVKQAASAWVDGNLYSTHATIVQGTDGLYYYCEEDHIADATNRPASGANWPLYWRVDLQLTAANVTWADGDSYSGARLYDIDIGELRECVDLLMASIPL